MELVPPQKVKKLKKPKLRPKVPQAYHRVRRKVMRTAEPVEPVASVPRITNETVAAHREQVLSRARKYIYPLQHSKHHIVKLSAYILIAAVVAFFVWCGVALYKLQSTSTFLYDVTRVVPFPVAKAGSRYVSYEDYLFELRRYIHYYQTQQKVNFDSDTAKHQLALYKSQALQQVIDDAYVKQLAAQHHISVSDREVDNEVRLVRTENRLGSSDQVFENVLNEFWGWSMDDFKRELKQQMLAQKVAATLDTTVHKRAQQALDKLKHGAKFEDVAKAMSDDKSTKNHGGEYDGTISPSNRDISPQVAAELAKLKPGQYSGIVDAGYTLEIVKVISRQGDKVKAAHIEFDIQDISTYIKPLKDKNPPHRYIKV